MNNLEENITKQRCAVLFFDKPTTAYGVWKSVKYFFEDPEGFVHRRGDLVCIANDLGDITRDVNPNFFKRVGIIHFYDKRSDQEIMSDFSAKFSTGGYSLSDRSCVTVPVNQRGIIKDAFINYFAPRKS